MTNKKYKKYLSLIIIFFIFFILVLPLKPLAAIDTTQEFELNVPIGGKTTFHIADGENPLGEYIKIWYGFMLGTVGILATIMIMWGGFKYLTSRGDKAMIESAKAQIISAITGVVLAFGTYTILNLINPALLTITMPALKPVTGGENVELGSYGREITGENATGAPNTTAPQTIKTNAENIPCLDKGVQNYSKAYSASYEGYRTTPYWDVNGYSIGYGHHYSKNQSVPQTITSDQALNLFNTDYDAARTAAESTFPNWLSLGSARQAALTDMAYNMGTGVFKKFPNMTAAIKDNNFNLAAKEISTSGYAKQLPQRAANNADIIKNNNNNLYVSQAQPACK
ncbi:MAG: glycoside hydrolase family protein [Patescibacteria group bacterium]